MSTKEFIIYGHDECPFCVKAKDLLNDKQETYTEKNIRENDEDRDYVISTLKQRTVPQIVLKDGDEVTHIGGFEKLQEYFGGEELF